MIKLWRGSRRRSQKMCRNGKRKRKKFWQSHEMVSVYRYFLVFKACSIENLCPCSRIVVYSKCSEFPLFDLWSAHFNAMWYWSVLINFSASFRHIFQSDFVHFCFQIVRKSKTPAQDRLKALMANHEKIAASIKEEITAMCNNTKTIHTSKSKPKPRGSAQTRLDDIPKKLDSVSSTNIKSSARIALNNNECIPSDPKQSVAKYKQNRLTAASNKQNKITKTKRSTRKTPAQQRLYDLQKAIIKDQLVSNKESEKTSQSHCNNALRELSSDSSRSTASSMGKNNEGDSKDSTDSVTDADIELKLVQDREFVFYFFCWRSWVFECLFLFVY